VQTSLKMLYWSMLMYDYEEVRIGVRVRVTVMVRVYDQGANCAVE